MRWPICTILLSPSSHTLLRSLLRACARQSSLPTAEKLHALILTTGLTSSPISFLSNSLLHAYAACGEFTYARDLFDSIPHSRKDTVDWTTLMGCLARSGMPLDALRLFVQMWKQNRPRPDDVTLVCMFNACAGLQDVGTGVQGHACMLRLGFGSSVKACNALMDMYVKSRSMSDARRVFCAMEDRSVVSWTVILDGAIRWEGLGSGRAVFNQMPEKNLVTWTIMIMGYVGNGFTREAFRLLGEAIFDSHLGLNEVALCSILSASAQSGDAVMGKWVHVYALKTMGRDMDIMVGTALLDMYTKCGRLKCALRVFESMSKRNLVVWNAMISGLAVHGRGELALDIFPRMLKEAKPDSLTFTSLLNACSHSGLVDQGYQYFHDLELKYGVAPKVEHYACMVDLLGRVGRVEEAEMIVRSMPMPPNEVVLGSLLGSCVVHGKLRLAESTLHELIKLDPHNTEYHVLLSNMYASEGYSEKAKSLRQALRAKGIRKIPGISSIHINGELHQFCAGDKSHRRAREVYYMLDEMIQRLKLAGYVPFISSQAENGINEMEEKEQALFSHSEKLAVCFGLISTKAGTPLYIFKNLRICPDCHSAIKSVSKIYEREIVVRDRSRFHRFKHGSCSCSDYW
ncbi:pentatricopeptide repeat-containing protein At5g15340, mitochondrial [Punica granatum]|uniref:DYW domain-containing protein n=2 Tax=Punica granatum TaxID=22663 RepID=A0A218VWX1_PUNGR|nr:pentatricopeptide repeat-containing protein At5g15340, mitochondrial [Punica granatum]OWM64560.1 hypothetical protein CDL15_Pgr020527 [Punica granatum]PKI47916.1 hypothetical protein CRG98_031700 [Punica granatum]